MVAAAFFVVVMVVSVFLRERESVCVCMCIQAYKYIISTKCTADKKIVNKQDAQIIGMKFALPLPVCMLSQWSCDVLNSAMFTCAVVREKEGPVPAVQVPSRLLPGLQVEEDPSHPDLKHLVPLKHLVLQQPGKRQRHLSLQPAWHLP